MHCPACDHQDTKVVDTRLATDGFSVRRRRECEKCGDRFSTLEEMEMGDVMVVKRNGRREAYVREKLSRGLKKALEKRPVTEEAFQRLLRHIERDIRRIGKRGEMTSVEIGERVLRALRRFDKVAFIRFASVYRAFEDVESFEKELRRLIHPSKKKKSV